MPRVPRPEHLPAGPLRDLVFALQDLYEDAGTPSVRRISGSIKERDDLPDSLSYQTVGQMLRGESRTGWPKYESVIRFLAERSVHRPDVDATVARLHELWLVTTSADAPGLPPAAAREPVSHNQNGPPRVERPAPAVTDVVGAVPPRNPRFVGRDPVLRTIREVLRTGASIVTLTGAGGVGKTQLMIEFLHRHRDEFDLVLWVPAEDPSELRAALAELGAQLGLPRSEAIQHPPAQVLEALAHMPARWLLVFDNAGPPDSLPPMSDLGTGRVLLTSRSGEWARFGSVLEVGVFERGESVRLLRDRAEEVDPTEADRLAARLGDLPLLVELAATWHAATGEPVAEFVDRIESTLRELPADTTMSASYPPAVAAFMSVAFAHLADTAPAAAQLLELFAWLGAAPLSLSLLRGGRQGAVTSPLREALRQPRLLNATVRELRRHGLVHVIDGSPERVEVHRVCQQVLRDRLPDKALARGRANVQAILAASNPGEPDDSRFWGHYAEVGPHILAADLATAEEFEVRRVALDQVRYLFRIGHYAQSEALGRQLVAASGNGGASETDHHFFVLVRHHLGNAMRMLGRYDEARRMTLEAFDYLDSHPDFGSQDEYLFDLDKNRAADLRVSGRYADALTVEEASLRRQVRDDADDQVKLRTIRTNIAVNYRLLGRFADAHRIDEEIVGQWTDARGAADPRTLFARTNLARDLFGLGRYADALREVRDLLPAYRRVVGENHHGVLLAVRTEVMALRKLGEHAEALTLAEENRRDLTTWFGPDHEHTLAAGVSLVNARVAAGDLGTATVEAPALLAACERLLGAEHPMTLAVQVNSASVLRALGDVHGARRRDHEVAAKLVRLLGEYHPYTLCANHNLAVDLARAGRQDEALGTALTVLTRSRAVRGDEHPDTLACAVNLTVRLGDETALRTVNHTVDTWETLTGTDHPRVTATRRGAYLECDIEPPPT